MVGKKKKNILQLNLMKKVKVIGMGVKTRLSYIKKRRMKAFSKPEWRQVFFILLFVKYN